MKPMTPKELQDLLDELEASRASRKRAWENLRRNQMRAHRCLGHQIACNLKPVIAVIDEPTPGETPSTSSDPSASFWLDSYPITIMMQMRRRDRGASPH
jgi:hypothetical protein